MDYIIELITGVITIASIIVALTPTPAPGTKWYKAYKILEALALIVYRAKDTGEVKKIIKRKQPVEL